MKSLLFTLVFSVSSTMGIVAQIAANDSATKGGSMAVSPARFELEMKPGTETTVVVNLDYRAGGNSTRPVRILATLNDWNITRDGRVEYSKANSLVNSASSWFMYSPGEAAVTPGSIHQIRVTISVPQNATPGDHLTALIIEQRPEKLKSEENLRQMIVRYRMASVFYIKVPGLTRKGSVEDLYAESIPEGIVVTPTLRNQGNSMIRPVATVKVLDADGMIVADVPGVDPLPILGGAELKQSVLIDKSLAPGKLHGKISYRLSGWR